MDRDSYRGTLLPKENPVNSQNHQTRQYSSEYIQQESCHRALPPFVSLPCQRQGKVGLGRLPRRYCSVRANSGQPKSPLSFRQGALAYWGGPALQLSRTDHPPGYAALDPRRQQSRGAKEGKAESLSPFFAPFAGREPLAKRPMPRPWTAHRSAHRTAQTGAKDGEGLCLAFLFAPFVRPAGRLERRNPCALRTAMVQGIRCWQNPAAGFGDPVV